MHFARNTVLVGLLLEDRGGVRFVYKKDIKGQCHEIFCFWFFHESVSPKPLSIPFGPFQFFRKFVEIFAAQGLPPVPTTPEANFATSFTSVVDTSGKFSTGVNDTGGKQWD